MRQTLTIRIQDELREELKKISKEESRPISDLVRESLRRYVAIRKFRGIRKKILPFAESQGILTDEDVYKLIS